MRYDDLLRRLAETSQAIFGENLTGVYLHGSAAMGCFQEEKSDLDLILVVEEDIPDTEKLQFMEHVIKWNEEAPAKGIELSIVKRRFCRPFVYPTPFELHFSEAHLWWYRENPRGYVEKMKGVDKDLAAHFTIIREYGIVLYGRPVAEVFGEVPREDYLDSIVADIADAGKEILENPVYIILNLCRVLAYLAGEDDSQSAGPVILSKKTGGEWGLRTLPERFWGILEEALRCYRDGSEMQVEPEAGKAFADYMLSAIKKASAESERQECARQL